ncbi:PepSY domain-containing protein, partial [Pseudoxanthomonas sp. SGD-10]
YVFNTELREMAAPHLYQVQATNKKLNVEELAQIVKDETKGRVSAVKIPFDSQRSYAFTVRKKEESHNSRNNALNSGKKQQTEKRKENPHSKSNTPEQKGRGRGNQFMVDPYTGKILGNLQETKTATSEFMQTMFSLHRWLLLDKVENPIIDGLENRKLGSYITGTATILFTIGVITGMIIWIPAKTRSWRQGLKIKTGGSWKRTNHDLHNTLGFYSCILLFLMGITGPQWSFEWYREGLRKTLGTHEAADTRKPDEPKSIIPVEAAKSLSVEELITIADKELPYEGDYSISFAADSSATVNLTKNKIGFFAPAAGDKLIMDQYSGKVIVKEIFKE